MSVKLGILNVKRCKRNTSLSYDLGICCGQKKYIYQNKENKVCEKCFSLENLYQKPQIEIINLIHLGMES